MPKRDFIPAQDDAFSVWFTKYVQYVQLHAVDLGLNPGQVNELVVTRDQWAAAYNQHVVTKDAARSAAATKDDRREVGERVLRNITGFVQNRRETTDAQRGALQITVPDREPTPTDPTAITRVNPPILWADTSKPRIVTLHFGPNPQDERRNHKPVEAYGARIWTVEGGPPTTPGGWDALAWTWSGDDTHSPYTYSPNRAGTFSFRAQWFDQLMNLGPLGDPITVAVTG